MFLIYRIYIAFKLVKLFITQILCPYYHSYTLVAAYYFVTTINYVQKGFEKLLKLDMQESVLLIRI